MEQELKRRDAVTPPSNPKEFHELCQIISHLADQVECFDSDEYTRGTAEEVFAEFSLRCRLVEAIGAFLRSEWVTEELRVPYEKLLALNEFEIGQLTALAERRWVSEELQNAQGSAPATVQ